jgi:hypothetical protein
VWRYGDPAMRPAALEDGLVKHPVDTLSHGFAVDDLLLLVDDEFARFPDHVLNAEPERFADTRSTEPHEEDADAVGLAFHHTYERLAVSRGRRWEASRRGGEPGGGFRQGDDLLGLEDPLGLLRLGYDDGRVPVGDGTAIEISPELQLPDEDGAEVVHLVAEALAERPAASFFLHGEEAADPRLPGLLVELTDRGSGRRSRQTGHAG